MILVGSNYFFKNMDNFHSKDYDYVELVEDSPFFTYTCHMIFKGKCIFLWKKMDANKFLEITLKNNLPMAIGKFLIPEFVSEINFTISHLKQLEPLINKLDLKHLYEKVIFDSYIQNDGFYLTNEQLLTAYEIYKKYR